MVAALNYDLKHAPVDLFDGARWTVLTMLIIHANERNRCWPTMRRLASLTGRAMATVSEAKQWLVEHGAIKLVPYEKRVEKELELSRRQHVYQLTGIIEINGKKMSYLYFSPENGDEEKEETEIVSPTEISVARSSSQHTLSISSIDTSNSSDSLSDPSGSESETPPTKAGAPVIASEPFAAYEKPIGPEPVPVKKARKKTERDWIVELFLHRVFCVARHDKNRRKAYMNASIGLTNALLKLEFGTTQDLEASRLAEYRRDVEQTFRDWEDKIAEAKRVGKELNRLAKADAIDRALRAWRDNKKADYLKRITPKPPEPQLVARPRSTFVASRPA